MKKSSTKREAWSFWIMLSLVLAGGVVSFWLVSMTGQNAVENDKQREAIKWD